MNDIFLAVHLIGLMMGAGGGLGSTVVMAAASKAPPEQAATLRGLGPALARLSASGLAVMWLSGVVMVVTAYPLAVMPLLFWVKMAFVLSLTAAAILIEISYAQAKGGDFKAAARLTKLGPVAGLSSIAAVLFAVFAFH